jgi:hypothetical protein
MANLSNINNKFLVTTGGNILIGQTSVVGSSILQVTGASSPLAIHTPSGNNGLEFIVDNGLYTNWQIGVQNQVGNALTIVPSTAAGNTTFSTPVATFSSSGNSTFAGNVSTGGSLISSNIIINQITSGTTNGNINLRNNAGSTITTFNNDRSVTFTGNVGIGAAPSAKLDISGNTVGSVQAIFGRGNSDSAFSVRYTNGITGTNDTVQGAIGLDYANGYWADMATVKFIRDSTSGELAFYTSASATSGVERMRITSGARINMDVMAGQASEGVIRIGRYDVNTSRYNEIQNSVTSTGAGSYMNLSVHSGTENVVTDVMTLLGSGRVGIGTTGPLYPLNVAIPYAKTSTGTQQFAAIFTTNEAAASNPFGLRIGIIGAAAIANRYAALQTTDYNLADGGNIVMQAAGGNVGIGVTSPSQKLQVDGGATGFNQGIPATSGATQNGMLRLTSGSSVFGETFDFGMNVAPTYAWIQATNKGSLAVNYNLALNPNGGNVGVGTTSPGDSKLYVHQNAGWGGTQYAIFANTYSVFGNLRINGNDANRAIIQQNDATLGIGTQYSKDITFFTNTSDERMRITSGGKVLIGRTDTDVSTNDGIIFNPNGEAYSSITTTGANTWHVYDFNTNNYRFFVSGAGQIYATSTSISAISDVTLKENIKPLETGLDEVMKLKPRRFDWKNGDGKNIAGFVAQEVEEILPDLVSDYKYTDTETKKSLKMGDMIPTLVKAIQELKAEIELLKSK